MRGPIRQPWTVWALVLAGACADVHDRTGPMSDELAGSGDAAAVAHGDVPPEVTPGETDADTG
jgi:hypothetical protein